MLITARGWTALDRYGRYAQARPPDWPAVPVAAFARFVTDCVSGLDGPEHGMAYDVQRFNELTRQMSAYAHITHPDNATRATSRARRRDAARALAEQVNARLRFRLDADARLRTAAQLLDSDHPAHHKAGRAIWAGAQHEADRELRDRHVSAGQDPWPLDGRYRAAVRYAERWGLPTPSWSPRERQTSRRSTAACLR